MVVCVCVYDSVSLCVCAWNSFCYVSTAWKTANKYDQTSRRLLPVKTTASGNMSDEYGLYMHKHTNTHAHSHPQRAAVDTYIFTGSVTHANSERLATKKRCILLCGRKKCLNCGRNRMRQLWVHACICIGIKHKLDSRNSNAYI